MVDIHNPMMVTIADIYRHINDPAYFRKHAIPMLNAMCEKARQSKEYMALLDKWLTEGGTVLLRDELVDCFKDADWLDHENHFYPFNDNWMAIDSARHAAAVEARDKLPKVFTVSHTGMWLGGISVVVAVSEEQARSLVLDAIKHDPGIRNYHLQRKKEIDEELDIEELDLTKPHVVMLMNGDY